jgi:hypothetical protein
MTTLRRRALLAVIVAVVVLTAAGTILWIAAILRPAPQIPPAPVVAERIEGGVLVLTVAPSGGDPIDTIGATVRSIGRTIASGRMPAADHAVAIAFEAKSPALRLVFDRGILVAGVISGQSPDHLLGLAGAGTRWPDPRAAADYCGRMETVRGTFCKHVRGDG